MSRLVKTPKLHVGDTGLACALLGVDTAALASDRALLGQLLETFVYQELRRQASWENEPVAFYHFRDRDGAEVDIVLEGGGRQVAGIEVKAAATVTAADLRGLRKLKQAAGKRFAAGVVLYDGEVTAPVPRWPVRRPDPRSMGGGVMDFLIAATSTYSLPWLTGDERESVKMTREALLWRLSARSGRSQT